MLYLERLTLLGGVKDYSFVNHFFLQSIKQTLPHPPKKIAVACQ